MTHLACKEEWERFTNQLLIEIAKSEGYSEEEARLLAKRFQEHEKKQKE